MISTGVWFQSSILTSTAARVRKAPFKTILTHGFVVDGEGKKMSKSMGNVINPQKVINQFGADIVRLFVSSADYTDDIRLSDDIIKQKVDAYRKVRNTCRYLLSTFDFDQSTDAVAYEEMLEIDQWALSRLQQLIEDVTEHYEKFQFHKLYTNSITSVP